MKRAHMMRAHKMQAYIMRALIFDFDGLILETEEPIYRSWQEIYNLFGQDLPLEEWAPVVGTSDHIDPLAMLEQRVGKALDRPALAARRKSMEKALIETQPTLPGVEQYLRDARRLGIKTAVASSSSGGWVVGHLERLGLRAYFDCIRVRENVTLTKPDPALFLAAAECLGVKPAEAIVLEDSTNGILAAKRAGMFCVAVPNAITCLFDLSLADLRVRSLAELPLEDLLRLASPPIRP